MSEKIEIATPPLAGVTEEKKSVSQETVPSEQSFEQSQKSGERQVERIEQPTSSQEGTRPKPSDFVTRRIRERQEMQNLKRTIGELTRTVEGLQKTQSVPSQPEKPKRDYNKEIWEAPINVIDSMINEALQERIPKMFDERLTQKQMQASRQEALDLIFTNEIIKQDGDEGYSRIIDILQKHKLDAIASEDPLSAAQSAIEIYELKYKRPNAINPAIPQKNAELTPTKGQMISTQTGVPSTSKEVSVDDLLNELKSLKQRITNNSDLNFDPEIKKRVAEIKQKLSERSKD